MGETIEVLDIGPDHVDWLLALNNAAVPHVNELTRADLDALLADAAFARMVVADGDPKGALIVFWPGLDYQSPHYRWFSERFESFLYVDRVMIAEDAKGAGLGRALYDALGRFAEERGAPRITLEVNSKPPNPGSLAFHERQGFRAVGELEHEGGAKRVVLMEKPLGVSSLTD